MKSPDFLKSYALGRPYVDSWGLFPGAFKGLASLIVSLVLLSGQFTSFGQASPLSIASVWIENGSINIRYQGRTNSYFLLLGNSSVTARFEPIQAALGADKFQSFSHSSGGSKLMFFRVEQKSLNSTDSILNDGIPDAWKLQKGLNPLTPNLVNIIPPGETRTWSQIYQAETSAAELPVASFSSGNSTVLAENGKEILLKIRFSKALTGNAIVLLGGDAVPEQDFHISGFVPENQTARAAITGDTASFTIRLKDPPSIGPSRHIVLSIVEPAATNSLGTRYRIGATAPSIHSLRIVEGDLGSYVGLLELEAHSRAESHPVRLALRSSSSGSVYAYLDATESSFFQSGFDIPVTLSANNRPGTFPDSVSGEVFSSALKRSLRWRLQLGTALHAGGIVEAPATLTIDGLSAGEKSHVSRGIIRLVPVTGIQALLP